MKRRWHLWGLAAVVVGLGFGVWRANSRTEQAVAQTGTICSGLINTSPNSTTAQPLIGLASVNLSMSTSTTPSPIQRVVFYIDGTINPLGRGVQQGTSTLAWSMMWATQVTQNGSHTIAARVYFADGSSCNTNPIPVQIFNSTVAQFALISNPRTWQGPTNVNADLTTTFVLLPNVTTIDLSQFVVLDWSSTIGSVAPLNTGAKFASGPAAGSGAVSVIARYGGRFVESISTVTVVSQDTTTYPAPVVTTTSTTPTSSTGTTPTTTTSANSTASAPSTSGGDANLESCILAAISKDRYDLFVGGKDRPTAQEFEKIRPCFARLNFVVPSNFTPLPPKSVADQKVNDNLKVANITNNTDKVDGNDTKKLVFTGSAKPNSSVLLYVFSEPLVLTTTADAQGNWTYSLEDPLVSGNHEVYAVVDKGNGSYERSNPFGFVIGTAKASAENPNGYSLEVTSLVATPKEKNGQTTLYIAGIVGIVIVLIAGLFLVLHRRALRRKQQATNEETISLPDSQPTSNQGTESPTYTNIAETNSIAPETVAPPAPVNDDVVVSPDKAEIEAPQNVDSMQIDQNANSPKDPQA